MESAAERHRLALIAFLHTLRETDPRPDETLYVGVDPGTEGAIGLLCGPYAAAVTIPNYKVELGRRTKSGKRAQKTLYQRGQIVTLFRHAIFQPPRRVVFTVEIGQVQNRGRMRGPKGRANAANAFTGFQVGVAYGMWPLWALEKNFDVIEVMPATWKKHLALSGLGKKGSLHKARSLWPNVDLALARDEGRAEALLIAHYGRLEARRRYETQIPTTAHRRATRPVS